MFFYLSLQCSTEKGIFLLYQKKYKQMKKVNKIAGLYGITSMMASDFYNRPATEPVKPLSEEEREAIIEEALRKINIARGLTEFFYGKDSVWALNQKNADRKAKKNGLI